MTDERASPADTEGRLREIVGSADTGTRLPHGRFDSAVLLFVPLAWSLFQLWHASPLPFLLDIAILNSTEARAVHLAFAVFLAFTAFRFHHGSPAHCIPVFEWLLALAAAFCAAYIYLFYDSLAQRSGAPTWYDLVVAVCGMLLLLEATRRALGPPLTVVAIVFLVYTFAGPYMPDVIAHKGASLAKAMSHMWLTTEGVFGVALGVSTSFVFLFVLFGALLDKAGAGNYFIAVAFSLLGHMRGGPAKAAVVSSGMTGVISGSSIANVVTTGTFTIPLMKRVGFPGTKAGAVEVAASTNGQLTPPVMGAAAFLMVEYVGISYVEVIKHAILPALLGYLGLIYIVHLEALKADMRGLPRRNPSTRMQAAIGFMGSLVGIMLLTALVYYGIGWLRTLLGGGAIWAVGALTAAAYLGLLRLAARDRTPRMDAEVRELPPVGATLRSGLYFILPVVMLVWCLVVERFSPGLSAFWATVFMIFVLLTHRPLLAWFRGEGDLTGRMREGANDLFDGLVAGARNMIGIGVATAAAGIVVGTVTLTGIGLVMTEFVEFISGGNLMLMLLFTAFICLVLGMGLPTTANYIVVSTLMAPVIVQLAAAHGLVVPLIAVHLFVFYFGILADDTPPVGLAAFAAAAISRADPIRTGVQGFAYDIRTAILPFMFIFNTQLLLIGLTGVLDLVLTIVSAATGMLLFAAATQGFWLTRSRVWESLALLLVAFTLFRPGFWWDRIYPPTEEVPGTRVEEVAAMLPAGERLVLRASGMTIEGDETSRTVALELPGEATADGAERLAGAGLHLQSGESGSVRVARLDFGSPAAKTALDFGWTIDAVLRPTERPPRELMYIPALLLLAGVAALQWRRRRHVTVSAQAGETSA
jgi:TRAP transporter 4TM/12TM fusion protein